jgi:hypothetical protein
MAQTLQSLAFDSDDRIAPFDENITVQEATVRIGIPL